MGRKPKVDLAAIDKAMARPVDDSGPVTAMSLRDWYAGKALHGAFVGGDTDIEDAVFARRCYELADAMLEARKR